MLWELKNHINVLVIFLLNVYEHYKHFQDDREHDQHTGRFTTSGTDNDLKKNEERNDERSSNNCWRDFCWCWIIDWLMLWNSVDVVGMKSVATKVILKLLNFQQKLRQMEVETLVHNKDVKGKALSFHWTHLESQRKWLGKTGQIWRICSGIPTSYCRMKSCHNVKQWRKRTTKNFTACVKQFDKKALIYSTFIDSPSWNKTLVTVILWALIRLKVYEINTKIKTIN